MQTHLHKPGMGLVVNTMIVAVCTLASGVWAAPSDAVASSQAALTYSLDQVMSRDTWRLDTEGGRGGSAWDRQRMVLDFRQGAGAVMLRFPDRSLPGAVQKIRIKLRGGAPGHTVSISLRTHFMAFSKTLGQLTGAGEQVLETDGPPGPGWTWAHGENDGKIHGPLRFAELRFGADGKQDQVTLELECIEIDAAAPGDCRIIMAAQAREQNGKPGFVAHCRLFSDEPTDGTLLWTLRRWDGDVVSEGKRAVRLPGGLELTSIAVPMPDLPQDCRFVEGEFTLDVPGQTATPVQAYWLADLEGEVDRQLRPESPFGMGVYLNRYSPTEMKRVAELAGRAGVKWSREDFSWARIEPRQGEFRWDYYDQLIDTAHQNGITVYAIIAYWTPWAKAYTAEGIADYVRYARALVRRYRDRIKYWEVWNEPNIFFWQGPREMYADLLIQTYKAIKEEDPDAQVLGLSTAGIDFGFIDQMLKRQTPFDVLTVHPYRKILDDTRFIDELKRASDRVQLPDGRRRPVWITEMGWATHVPHHVLGQDFAPNTQRVQAEMLSRTYLCTIASGVEPRTFWYNFRNDGEDPFYFEHNMGILYRDGRPKPAYVAYATMTRLLNQQRFVRSRTDLGDIFAAEFEAASGTGPAVMALWSAQRDQSVAIPSPQATATLVNAIGESRTLHAEQGKIQFQLKAGAPAYLITGASQ